MQNVGTDLFMQNVRRVNIPVAMRRGGGFREGGNHRFVSDGDRRGEEESKGGTHDGTSQKGRG